MGRETQPGLGPEGHHLQGVVQQAVHVPEVGGGGETYPAVLDDPEGNPGAFPGLHQLEAVGLEQHGLVPMLHRENLGFLGEPTGSVQQRLQVEAVSWGRGHDQAPPIRHFCIRM